MRNINLTDFYEGQYRMLAASAALAWLDGKDYTFDALDAIVQDACDIDETSEMTDEEQTFYAETFESVADFLVNCGADSDAVAAFLGEESDDRGLRLAGHVTESPSFLNKTDNDLIENFISGGEMIEEKVVKKIVGGKVKWVKKKLKKKRLSSAQRAGLKKARRKGKSGATKRKRLKSLKKRKSLGM
ncbi:MAG: hypothetical protein GY866_17320 [Proteobacteria bacterium]|nr:hypothetical protein [Pseudomonadota bacterium]